MYDRNNYCLLNRLKKASISSLPAAGFAPGKELGDVLNQLLLLVIEEPQKNTKEVLLKESEKMKKSTGNE